MIAEIGTLTEAVQRLNALAAELKAHEEAATQKSAALRREIAARKEQMGQVEAGLDPAMIDAARKVLVTGGYLRGGDDREKARAEAINALAVEGGGFLFHEYTGTKSYDRWHGQHIRCTYGMGPRHGSVIFSIGLAEDVRKRGTLTPAEIEAAVYYLTHLASIEQAAQKAAA